MLSLNITWLTQYCYEGPLGGPIAVEVRSYIWDLDAFAEINVIYDTAKTAINRMALGMAHNLRPYNIAAVALAPGWMRTEKVMCDKPPHIAPTPEELKRTESVEYVGRAIVALACDPRVLAKTGRTLRVGDLAREYGSTDIDGRQPDFYGDKYGDR